jgi:hypothetical protein
VHILNRQLYLHHKNCRTVCHSNRISKVHDWVNSVGYSDAGFYLYRGGVYNTLFDVYSFAGMLPAAAYTTVAITAAYPIDAIDELRRRGD